MLSIKNPLFIKRTLCSSLHLQPIRRVSIKTTIISDKDAEKSNDVEFITHPLFPHPVFDQKDCESIEVTHREPRTIGDKIAHNGILFFRSSFDLVTGYKKPHTPEQLAHGFKGTRYEMTAGKWLTRCIFLESVAGVPGMVAAFLRHLHSIRLLKRDKAWIETLLDEAYNERMHLLTFMKIGKPSWFTRFIIYVGQGVFCNIFFLVYLMNPRYCHRFVGYLEEEAVETYTHMIHDLDANKFPELNKLNVPEIAIQYWPKLTKESTMRDLILRIRADESKHREVNHTLANLDQKSDRNPFALQVETDKPQPENGLKVTRPEGWERSDIVLSNEK
ncbi:putative alternative oxidase, mitochondrial [[Candida] railenensis]|uniref:Alternative oxidase n=1 Tax=[Candida] railenensis TaxID=45579 RepID=A0A9P0QRB7_9ASCO|nr:putative alternative oxidase, mitochondrial [[Candida] railenensis]